MILRLALSIALAASVFSASGAGRIIRQVPGAWQQLEQVLEPAQMAVEHARSAAK